MDTLKMNTAIKVEELALFLSGVYVFSLLNFAWWWFLVLILTPDIGALGYLFGNKAGAFLYNLFHHKGLAVLLLFAGMYINSQIVELIGVILFSHASLDRIFGYGLKYEKGFAFTHLGKIGK